MEQYEQDCFIGWRDIPQVALRLLRAASRPTFSVTRDDPRNSVESALGQACLIRKSKPTREIAHGCCGITVQILKTYGRCSGLHPEMRPISINGSEDAEAPTAQ